MGNKVLNSAMERLGFRKNQPLQITDGIPPEVHLEEFARQEEEINLQKLLGTKVSPAYQENGQGGFSPSEYALFGGKRPVVVEVHTDDSKLQPYELPQGKDVLLVPALFKLVQRGALDFQVMISAHEPQLRTHRKHMKEMREHAETDERVEFLDRFTRWVSPKNGGGIIRNLWIFADPKTMLPMRNGEKRGAGGRPIKYIYAGNMLQSYIHRRGPRPEPVLSNQVGGRPSRHYHLEATGISKDPIEYQDYLMVEGMPFAFFKGGIVDNGTYPKLAKLGVDILLRFEFLDNSDRLWVTPLLRASGSVKQLADLYEQLKDIGGWTRIQGKDQREAFLHTIWGNKFLPSRYGRREVLGWHSVDEKKPGLLHLIAKDLAPVGNPQGRQIAGKIGGVPYTWEPRGPSMLVTGPSEVTGKSTLVGAQALFRHDFRVFWVNWTSSILDSAQMWGPRFGGITWHIDLPDAEDIILQETGDRGKPEELDQLRYTLHQEGIIFVDALLARLYEASMKAGKWVYLPFILQPMRNNARTVDIITTFQERLPIWTQKWTFETGQRLAIVNNDTSHLLSLLNEGNEYEIKLARKAAERIAWPLSHGANHGLESWCLTHDHLDLNVLLERNVYGNFSHELRGGLEGQPNYHFDLMVPSTKEVEVRLNFRYSDELREIFQRLHPDVAQKFLATYKPPSILFGEKAPSNGRPPAKERAHGRSTRT